MLLIVVVATFFKLYPFVVGIFMQGWNITCLVLINILKTANYKSVYLQDFLDTINLYKNNFRKI